MTAVLSNDSKFVFLLWVPFKESELFKNGAFWLIYRVRLICLGQKILFRGDEISFNGAHMISMLYHEADWLKSDKL